MTTAKITVKSLENKHINEILNKLLEAVEKYYTQGKAKHLVYFRTLRNLRIKEKIVKVEEL